MEKSFDVKAVFVAVIVGVLLVLGIMLTTGDKYATPVLPFMAMLAGFIVTGLIVGFMSKGETISEPGLASIVVGLIVYFVVPTFNLHCFISLTGKTVSINLLLVVLNGIILTFIGAWVGEKLQGTYENNQSSGTSLEWGYIIAGTVLGITISMLFANLIILIADASLSYLIFALLLGLGVTGFIIGLRSPGVTINEAIIAGIITVVLNLDIFKMSLDLNTDFLGKKWILLMVVLGTGVSFLGGFIGEKVQGNHE